VLTGFRHLQFTSPTYPRISFVLPTALESLYDMICIVVEWFQTDRQTDADADAVFTNLLSVDLYPQILVLNTRKMSDTRFPEFVLAKPGIKTPHKSGEFRRSIFRHLN
jgi:hypothetical protein